MTKKIIYSNQLKVENLRINHYKEKKQLTGKRNNCLLIIQS